MNKKEFNIFNIMLSLILFLFNYNELGFILLGITGIFNLMEIE